MVDPVNEDEALIVVIDLHVLFRRGERDPRVIYPCDDMIEVVEVEVPTERLSGRRGMKCICVRLGGGLSDTLGFY